jgi:single-strand DNA-binding protein
MYTLNNNVRLTGFLGGAPEIKLTGNKKKFAKICLATNTYRKNSAGERVSETTWHQLILWEQQAELAEKYLDRAAKFLSRAVCLTAITPTKTASNAMQPK